MQITHTLSTVLVDVHLSRKNAVILHSCKRAFLTSPDFVHNHLWTD